MIFRKGWRGIILQRFILGKDREALFCRDLYMYVGKNRDALFFTDLLSSNGDSILFKQILSSDMWQKNIW